MKIWFVLRSYGTKGLQEYIERTTKIGEEFGEWVREKKELFEVLTGPSFALTVFRMTGKDEEERNDRTKKLAEKINASGKIWVTSTVLDGRYAIRFMTGVRKTEREDVERAFAGPFSGGGLASR